MSNADRWCNDCAWPEDCAARMECHRRDAGEVRGAEPPELCNVFRVVAGPSIYQQIADGLGLPLADLLAEPVQTGGSA